MFYLKHPLHLNDKFLNRSASFALNLMIPQNGSHLHLVLNKVRKLQCALRWTVHLEQLNHPLHLGVKILRNFGRLARKMKRTGNLDSAFSLLNIHLTLHLDVQWMSYHLVLESYRKI